MHNSFLILLLTKFKFVELFHKIKTKPVSEVTIRLNKKIDPAPDNFLEELASNSTSNPFTKWWHYFEIYNEKMKTIAQASREGNLKKPIRILELGVWQGGSLELWRNYFGNDAIIYGIDIHSPQNPVTVAQIRIGSQDDPVFLNEVIKEMGGVDIIIDDGSHISKHVINSFKTLWPLLNPQGLYFIEDLHTSYWPNYGGGYRRNKSSIEYLKNLIDLLNCEYFTANIKQINQNKIARPSSIEFFDSVVLVRKGTNFRPELFVGGNLDLLSN